MFGDTHCHLMTMQEREIDLQGFFEEFEKISAGTAKEYGLDGKIMLDTPFLLDIGTDCDDLAKRLDLKKLAENKNYLYFSAGIWPGEEAINDRFNQMEELKKQIAAGQKKYPGLVLAIGECGIDKNHNPAEKGAVFLAAEEELFAMQAELAKNLNLPLIIHSRDDFERTYGVLKNSRNADVIIHCFSYGIEQARAFLDLGYYISFSGTITFGKGERLETSRQLLRYVPKDRLLLETDAPFLAPVPCRGQTNTPLLIGHTYRFVADALQMPLDQLALLVWGNAKQVFRF